MTENEISRHIVHAAIEVHRTLGGPGLLENVYEEALAWELQQRGLIVERQLMVPVKYKGQSLTQSLRLDLLVDHKVIVEVKATNIHNPIFEAQALTYLRLMGLRLAMVINFGERRAVDGIHRVVNRLD
jgi:GxxExxY protein